MTELQAVTKPMLDAWVAWEPGYDPEPPLTPKQSAFVRHAFYAGWFASQASPPPQDEVERLIDELVFAAWNEGGPVAVQRLENAKAAIREALSLHKADRHD